MKERIPPCVGGNPSRKIPDGSLTHFLGTCVELPGEKIQAYDDGSTVITYDRFRALIGTPQTQQLGVRLGYVKGEKLSLRSDWAVHFTRGLFDGAPAVACLWSGIHHFFTAPPQAEKAPVLLAPSTKTPLKPRGWLALRRIPRDAKNGLARPDDIV